MHHPRVGSVTVAAVVTIVAAVANVKSSKISLIFLTARTLAVNSPSSTEANKTLTCASILQFDVAIAMFCPKQTFILSFAFLKSASGVNAMNDVSGAMSFTGSATTEFSARRVPGVGAFFFPKNHLFHTNTS